MNKYLVKIAEKKKEGYGGDAIVGGVGVGLAKRQYDHGHLTGRTTYYHGSTKGVTDRIKEEGIVPRKSTGIIDKMDMDGSFKKVNENLAFATKTKLQAHFYAAQAKHLQRG